MQQQNAKIRTQKQSALMNQKFMASTGLWCRKCPSLKTGLFLFVGRLGRVLVDKDP
jgi:hypothetical protein